MSTHLTPLNLACTTAAKRVSQQTNKKGVQIWAPFLLKRWTGPVF
jgi:hypothetical protein